MHLKEKKICIIGLGYVGLPLAIEFGKSYNVLGFDLNKNRIRELRENVDQLGEISKNELIKSKYISFSDKKNDLKHGDIYIITVPTPVDKRNDPDLRPLKAASRTVAEFLEPQNIVIYESTVFPGATRNLCLPILEKVSGLKCIQSSGTSFEAQGFHLGYSPERINPGDKEKSISSIIKVTSGSTKYSADIIDNLYKSIITAGTHKAPSIEVAESAKIIENTQRDVNIAFLNEVSKLLDRMDIDTTEVLRAAGTKWNFMKFTPGFVGGHCIGVDPYYLVHAAKSKGIKIPLIEIARNTNETTAQYAALKIISCFKKSSMDITKRKIGLFGFTFKDNCKDIRNTKINDLYTELSSCGCLVDVIDPLADRKEVLEQYGIELRDLENCQKFDALVFAVSHEEFSRYSMHFLLSLCTTQEKPILADFKSIFDKDLAKEAGFKLIRF